MKSLMRRFSRNRTCPELAAAQQRQRMVDELQAQLPDASLQQCELIASVQSLTMTSPERILAACQAVEHLAKAGIEGDIVECGVWRGGSMVAMARTLIGQDDLTRTLWLYDTFEGMSAPTDRDVDFLGRNADAMLEAEDRQRPESIWCYSPLEQVQDSMEATGYPDSQIRYIQGRVEQTLPQTVPDSIALLRLDTDWYESTKCELEYLFPRLVNGGILIIDDYGHWEGCRRAVDEYLQQHQLNLYLHRIDYTGRMAQVSRAS